MADTVQSLAYTISFHWIHIDAMLAPTVACTAQGWLVNTGRIASGLFVLLIALHTLYKTMSNADPSRSLFLGLIAGTWGGAILLSSLGIALFGDTYYVATGVFCGVSTLYPMERLALQMLWIFIVQFGSILAYLVVFIRIKTTIKRTMSVSNLTPDTRARVDRAARTMVLYPLVYIVLSLPISTGRMWSMAHHGASLPLPFIIGATTLYALSGSANAILYTLTRYRIVKGNVISSTSTGDPNRSGLSRRMSYFRLRKGSSSTMPMLPSTDMMDGLPFDGAVGRHDSYALGMNDMAKQHVKVDSHCN